MPTLPVTPAPTGTPSAPQARLAEAMPAPLRQHVDRGLRPLVQRIDREGHYPQEWLNEFATLGGLSALAPTAADGSPQGLAVHIQRLAAVGAHCGATAFTLWCQSACIWYLRHSPNQALREQQWPALVQGRQWAGTGLSNTVKHMSSIERHLLQAQPDGQGGWRVSGSLPWVSNLGPGHILLTAAQLPSGDYAMLWLPTDQPGVQCQPCPEFCALEGTATLNVRLDNAPVPATHILAGPEVFEGFLQRIKPGFILLQMGMALGVIDASIRLIEECQNLRNPCNIWLDDQAPALRSEWAALHHRTLALATLAENGQAPLLDVLRVRLHGSELALRAAQSAALHTGARGYLMRHSAQRLQREALFVAIVTPALKQLRRDIAQLEGAGAHVRAHSLTTPANQPATALAA